jgi:hypothetical protein
LGSVLWGGFAEASHVFEGTVQAVEIEQAPKGSLFPISTSRVTLRVTRVWKGPHSAEVLVETTPSEASCGYEFTVGTAYVVYAYTEANATRPPWVSLCGRTKGGRWRLLERMLLGPAAWKPGE